MDDALDAAAGVGSDGGHVASASQGHDRLLERARQFARVDELVESGPQPVVGDPDGTAQSAEARRRGVGHLAGGVEAAIQRVSKAWLGVDLACQVAQQRPSIAAQRFAQASRGFERLGDVEEVARLQPTAACRPLDPGQDVLAAAYPRAGVLGHE